MEKVWISKGNPQRVVERENVHYFYFPIELGIGKTRIFGIELPLPLPIKAPDYEPIKVVRVKGEIHIISRFHYRILTYFNDPRVVKNRAIVDFSLGSHSPYVHSKHGSKLGMKIAIERLGAIEVQWVLFLALICLQIVSGKMKIGLDTLHDYDVEKGQVPEDAVFVARKCHSVIWIGTFPERQNTPKEVWDVFKD